MTRGDVVIYPGDKVQEIMQRGIADDAQLKVERFFQ
jgi:hypothetical protein